MEQNTLEQLLLVLAGAMSPSHSRILNLHSNVKEKLNQLDSSALTSGEQGVFLEQQLSIHSTYCVLD